MKKQAFSLQVIEYERANESEERIMVSFKLQNIINLLISS